MHVMQFLRDYELGANARPDKLRKSGEEWDEGKTNGGATEQGTHAFLQPHHQDLQPPGRDVSLAGSKQRLYSRSQTRRTGRGRVCHGQNGPARQVSPGEMSSQRTKPPKELKRFPPYTQQETLKKKFQREISENPRGPTMKPLLPSTDVFKREFAGICQLVEPWRSLCSNSTRNPGP